MSYVIASDKPFEIPASLYSSIDNYQDEQANIFEGESWNYLALECEIPNPGDFIQASIGETSIVIVRDNESLVKGFINRCTHRGAKVCIEASGHTKSFVCPYHEWSFNLQGELRGIPYKNGVNGRGGVCSQFSQDKKNLTKINVSTRNGVIFGSLSEHIEPLENYLGPKILAYFDRVCDGRPLKIIGKTQHIVKANWKLLIENVKDPLHAGILHSFFKEFGIWRSDQETQVIVDSLGRNSVLVSKATFNNKANSKPPKIKLKAPELIEFEKEFDGGTGAVMTIWPNLIFLQQLNCLVMRHVKPAGPSESLQTWTFFGYENEENQLTQKRLHQANLLGPSGLVTIDDNEVLAIVQEDAHNSEHIPVIFPFGEGEDDTNHMITEGAIRAFYLHYKSIMVG